MPLRQWGLRAPASGSLLIIISKLHRLWVHPKGKVGRNLPSESLRSLADEILLSGGVWGRHGAPKAASTPCYGPMDRRLTEWQRDSTQPQESSSESVSMRSHSYKGDKTTEMSSGHNCCVPSRARKCPASLHVKRILQGVNSWVLGFIGKI